MQNSAKVHFGTGYRSIAPGSPDPITSDQSDQVLTGWRGSGFFSGTAGTCRVRVRNPGALRGRLGAGVVAYVPRYGAYVTLSRAPRETAVFPVHWLHRITSGRYASAAYPPAGGGTTDNMARIPGGGFLECCDMLRAGLVALRPFGVSVWFAMVRFRGDLPAVSHCPAMARYGTV